MAVKVKICGVRTREIADAVIDAGADYIGMVFYRRSPRHLTLDEGAHLVEAIADRLPTVAVLVEPNDDLIDDLVAKVKPDYLQLHGDETPERVAAIKVRSELPLIKALPVATAEDVARAANYAEIADMVLFDAKITMPGAAPGGNGLAFDWKLLADPEVVRPFGISGGLDAGNVEAAIAMTKPDLVDVSSGVESAPGVKDVRKIRAFVRAARAAEAVLEAEAIREEAS